VTKTRTALVTGSTSGIGLGMARALAASGFDVMLNGFGESGAIASLVRDIAAGSGTRIEHHPADMSDPAQVRALVRDTRTRFAGLDVLVNNAGIQHVAPLETFPDEVWQRIIAINLSAAFYASAEALPGMRERGWGRIINTSSVHGLVASVHKAAYVSAKHGIIGLTRVTALESAGSGITCNAICPGFVRTPLADAQIAARAAADGSDLASAASAVLGEKQPSGEFVTVEQIGALLCFLCSPAADQITGAALPIDGGWTAQ